MPHLHTEPGEYDHTVSAFIIKHPDELHPEPRALLHEHKKLNVLLHPGGHIEIHENPWAALAHEIEEETGYVPEQLNVLQPSPELLFPSLDHSVVHPTPIVTSSHGFKKWGDHYHTDSTYCFTTDQYPLNTPGEDESAELHWVTYGELQNIPEGQVVEGARQVGLKALSYFYTHWYPHPFHQFGTHNPPAF